MRKLYDGKHLIAFCNKDGTIIYNKYAFKLSRLRKKIKRFINYAKP